MADRYWVGGTGTWNTTSTTNWSATSGGASGASVPTVSDSVFFDQASTYTVTMTGALACLDFNVTGGTVTFQNGTTPTLNVRGGWSTVAATVWNTTGAITFSATTSRTITTNAITIRSPITFNGTGGTWTLQDNVSLLSTLTTTLTAGTLALSTFTLTTGLFNSSGSTARTINFGTGKIVLNSATTSTIWNTGTTTNLTISGTPLVECIGGGTAVTKTINTGAPSEANSISFSLLDTGGTPTYAFSASNVIRNLIVNGAQTVSNVNLTIYGSFTHQTTNGTTTFTAGTNAWIFAATSGSYTITNIDGFTYNFPWTFGSAASTATWTIAANLTLGATRQLSLVNGTFDFNNKTFSGAGVTIATGTPTIANTDGPGSLSLTVPITHSSGSLTLPFNLTTTSASGYTLTAGTLTLNNFILTAPVFSSSGASARTLAFGTTGQLALTGNGVTIIGAADNRNLTITGTLYVNCTYTGSVGTRTILWGSSQGGTEATAQNVSFSGTTGIVLSPSATDTIALSGGFNNIDFTGFTGTLSSTARTLYGNLTLPASGGTFTAGTNVTTFGGTGTRTITTNGRTIDFPLTFSGVGGTFRLLENLTVGSTRLVTLTNGTLDLNNFTLSAGQFNSSGSTARVLAFGTGQLALTGNNLTLFDITTATNFSTTGTVYVKLITGSVGTRTFVTGFTQAQAAAGYDVSTSGTSGIVITPSGNVLDIIALTGNYNNVDLTGFTNTLSNTARTIFGNFIVPASGGTFTAGTTATTFTPPSATTKTITSNGRLLDFPITVNGAAGSSTLQLIGNLTLGSSRDFTLTQGIIDINNNILSTGSFSSNNSNTRTLAFGSTGQLALTFSSTGTVFNLTTATNFTTTGTVYINAVTGARSGTGTYTTGFTEAQAAGYDVKTTGTAGFVINAGVGETVIISGNWNNFDLTGFTGTFGNATRSIYGNFTIPSTGGSLSAGTSVTSFVGSGSKTLSTGGRTLDFPVTIDGAGGTFQLLSNFAIGSTRAFTLTAGALDLNDFILSAATFSSNNGNIRSVAFGSTGIITLGGNSATIVDFTNMTNFTYTGTPKIYSTYTGAVGTRTFNFGNAPATGATSTNVFDLSIGTSGDGLVISTGTDILAPIGSFNNFNLTGLTQTVNNNGRFIYGDFTVPASGGTLTAGTNVLSFFGVSGTKNITTNGRTLDFPITFNGAATFRLQSALLQGSTRAFTHNNGTIDLNGYTLTVGTAYTTATGTKNLTFNGGSLVCPANTATAFNNAVPGGFTTTAGTGTGTISLTAATAKTFVGNNAIYNCDIDQGGAGALTITGFNTFNRIKSSYANTTANASILLPIETIVTGIVGGSASNKMLDLGPATATAAPFRASVVISNSSIQTASYVQANSIVFNTSELLNPSTQSSVFFDGTGDYLTIADNAALQMGSGNFTIEFWWYPNSIAGYQTPYDKGYTGSGGLVLQTGNGDGRIIVYASGSAVVTSNTALIANSWTHMALVRNGTNLTLYQNGISVGSATNSTNFNNANTAGIGGNATGATFAGQYPINGYISNLRSVKGTAVYTSAFTPPAAPLTAIANTSLLTCQGTTFVDNGPNNFAITAVGNSTVSPFSPFRPFITNGNVPWRWYLANSINRGDTLGAVFQEYSNSAPIVYYITSGTSFTVPADWDNSNNAIHIYGAGGGSSGSYVPNASGNRLGSAGGGGGGYTQVLNFTATPGSSVSYSIGLGGAAGSANNLSSSGGAGGNTTFAGIYTANGGGGSSITSTTTTAGTGGTGATANGGVGGLGGGAASATSNSSGGGGGGSGGPNGAGANGGTGTIGGAPSTCAGGGGGGSSGGTNGTNAATVTPGTGGNNFAGTRAGGIGGLGTTFGGISGGRERGRASYDILGSVGGAGGGGGGGAVGPGVRDELNIGGGAGGSGATDSDFANPGTSGQSGGIIIVYYPSAVVSGNFSNMFLLF